MLYLQEGAGEISKAEFEAILGANITVGPSAEVAGYYATVDALEASREATHMSCIVNLDGAPPPWLGVLRENGGYLIIKDWKYENGRHFCPVGISGGPYDPQDPGQSGPFTLSLFNTNVGAKLLTISGIGWNHRQNHQHPNLYVSLHEGEPEPEPDPEPEPEPDPEPEPEPDVIAQVRALIVEARALLDEALELLGT